MTLSVFDNSRLFDYGPYSPISNLEVSGLSFDSVLLSWQPTWTEPDEALNFQYEYRQIGDTFWTPTGNPNVGSSGLTNSTNNNYILGNLNQDTKYEFRVRPVLKSGRPIDWSNHVLFDTFPNIPLFDTTGIYPFKLFVNSPTTTYRVSIVENNTSVNTPDQGVITLDRGDVLTGNAIQGDIIESTAPISGYALAGQEPYELMRPWCFDKKFVFNQVRANPQAVYIYAAQDANVVLKKRNVNGDITHASSFISAGGTDIYSWSDTRTHEIISDGYIAVFAISRYPNVTNPYDQKPIIPPSAEILVSPSTAAYVSSYYDNTKYEWYSAEGDFAGKISIDRNAYEQIPRGSQSHSSNGRYHTCGGTLVKSNKLIFAASVADSNGIAQIVGLPTKFLGTRCTLPSDTERLKIDSKFPTFVKMFYPGNTTNIPDETHQLKGVLGGQCFSFYWGNRSSPFDQWNGTGATFGVVPEGTYIEADEPFAANIEPIPSGATECNLFTV